MKIFTHQKGNMILNVKLARHEIQFSVSISCLLLHNQLQNKLAQTQDISL